MAASVSGMSTYVLVPGMWLGAWAWHDVTAALRAAGHDVYPLSLTGVADRSHLLGPDVDLDTHIADIVRLAEVEDLRDVVLVGHSYGGMPVSAAALPLRDRIRAVVYVDSGPLPEGTTQLSISGGDGPAREDDGGEGPARGDDGGDGPAREDKADDGPAREDDGGDGPARKDDDGVAPPDWDPASDPVNLAGLNEAAVAKLRARSTPHPRASVAQPLGPRATSADLPTVLVACTFPIDQVRAMMAAGHPFFSGLAEATIVPLATGHWPMLSEPAVLATILDDVVAARVG
jgi:pimeloyl-ACP methyl ester carboxylesterase